MDTKMDPVAWRIKTNFGWALCDNGAIAKDYIADGHEVQVLYVQSLRELDKAKTPDHIQRSVSQEMESSEVVVTAGLAFTHVAKIKLEDLLARGWVISGYSIQKDNEHGLITEHGFVGWYSVAFQNYDTAEKRVKKLAEALQKAKNTISGLGYPSIAEDICGPALKNSA